MNSLLNLCFFILFRERVSLKRREEAWEKLEEAAKRNPTFYELAESLNVPSSSSSSSTFDRFGASSSFAMIDEDGNGAGGGEDEDLLEELAAYEAAKQCDTQVNGEKERVGSLSESLMSCFCLQAATGDKQQRDNAWRRKSKLSIDLVSSTTGPSGGSSYAAAAAASANLDGTSSISPTSSTSINSTVVRSQNSTDIAAVAAAASGEPADDKGSVGDR